MLAARGSAASPAPQGQFLRFMMFASFRSRRQDRLEVMALRWRASAKAFVILLTKAEGRRAARGGGRVGLRLGLLGIDMAEVAIRRDLIPHHLLQLLDLGKASLIFARPDQLAVNPHLEDAARVVGNERD